MTYGSALRTPLFDVHVRSGGKMVEFAGYEMPLHYMDGIMREHVHTREFAGLFDVSHMGQAVLIAENGEHSASAEALEALVPADVLNLKPGQQRYTQLLNSEGGIIDDLMVARSTSSAARGGLSLIVNASRKEQDYDYLQSNLPTRVTLVRRDDRALVALQGPAAYRVLERACPAATELAFMQTACVDIDGIPIEISRSGYTGEDGFEISVAAEHAVALWDRLSADERVRPVGLGARDSLRLEAGLCLYGHDLDETTSPVEAGLSWSIQKRRRQGGGFAGADRVLRELAEGPARIRVGVKPDGKAPFRHGSTIFANESDEEPIGLITSGGFGPSVQHPVAMGYIRKDLADVGRRHFARVRDKHLPFSIVEMPFFPHRFRR